MRSQLQLARSRRGIGRLEIIVAAVAVVIIASVAIALLMKSKQDDNGGAGNLSPEELQKKHRANLLTVRNNMKHLMLGCQNHSDAYKTFPALYFSADQKIKAQLNVTKAKGAYPWTVRLLPFIEEDTLYRQISTKSGKFMNSSESVKIEHDGKTISPREIDLTELQSPHLGERSGRGNNNYVALSATRLPLLLNTKKGSDGSDAWSGSGPDGMIIPDKLAKGQSLARMADGPSKTAIFCESSELEKSNWYEPTQTFVVGFLPGDSTAHGDSFYPSFEAGKWTPNPKTGDRTALDYGPTADDPKHVYNASGPLARAWGPSGGNPIGKLVVHAMGDGSIRMISTDIDPKVYFALITPRGGEKEPLPEDAKVKE